MIDQIRLRREGRSCLVANPRCFKARASRLGFAVDAVRPVGVDRPWSSAAVDERPAQLQLKPEPPADATPAPEDLQPDD